MWLQSLLSLWSIEDGPLRAALPILDETWPTTCLSMMSSAPGAEKFKWLTQQVTWARQPCESDARQSDRDCCASQIEPRADQFAMRTEAAFGDEEAVLSVVMLILTGTAVPLTHALAPRGKTVEECGKSGFLGVKYGLLCTTVAPAQSACLLPAAICWTQPQ